MASLWCLVFTFLSLFAVSSVIAVEAVGPETEELDFDREFDALRFLERQGVTNYGEILYHKRTDNVSLCLQREDAKERVLRMCTGRAVFEECLGAGESYWFDTCTEDRCIGNYTAQQSFCMLEASGVLGQLNASLNAWICDLTPESLPVAFAWSPPPWMAVVGNQSELNCLTAMPSNGRLDRRIVCEDGQPILQHRVSFDSASFLRTNERTVGCVAHQDCGLPTIFAGEFSCYEIMHDELDTEDAEMPDMESDDVSSGHSLNTVSFHTLCISFILFSVLTAA